MLIAWLIVGHGNGTKNERLVSLAPRLYAAGNTTAFITDSKHAALRTAYLKLDGANAKGQMKETSTRRIVHEQHLELITKGQKLVDKLHAQTK